MTRTQNPGGGRGEVTAPCSPGSPRTRTPRIIGALGTVLHYAGLSLAVAVLAVLLVLGTASLVELVLAGGAP